jgi:hypothetical protein
MTFGYASRPERTYGMMCNFDGNYVEENLQIH